MRRRLLLVTTALSSVTLLSACQRAQLGNSKSPMYEPDAAGVEGTTSDAGATSNQDASTTPADRR